MLGSIEAKHNYLDSTSENTPRGRVPRGLNRIMLGGLTALELAVTACGGNGAEGQARRIASDALKAMIAGDSQGFSQLVAPDKRFRPTNLDGLIVDQTTRKVIASCDGQLSTEPLVRPTSTTANEVNSTPGGYRVTFLFRTPCIGNKYDSMTMVLNPVNGQLMVHSIASDVNHSVNSSR